MLDKGMFGKCQICFLIVAEVLQVCVIKNLGNSTLTVCVLLRANYTQVKAVTL